MAELLLVRDVLDQQLLDRRKRRVGKVDGIVVELGADDHARVLYLEVGNAILAHRVARWLGRLCEWLREHVSPHRAPPLRISWKKVRDIDVSVHVDVDASAAETERWEGWLREHVIEHIPGASHDKGEGRDDAE